MFVWFDETKTAEKRHESFLMKCSACRNKVDSHFLSMVAEGENVSSDSFSYVNEQYSIWS